MASYLVIKEMECQIEVPLHIISHHLEGGLVVGIPWSQRVIGAVIRKATVRGPRSRAVDPVINEYFCIARRAAQMDKKKQKKKE